MVSLIKKEIPNSELDKQPEFGTTSKTSFYFKSFAFLTF